MSTTHYEILGVAPTATLEDIKAAHRRMARVTHPDAGGSAALFQQVQDAYSTLSNALLRREYDDTLKTPRSSSSASPEPDPRANDPRYKAYTSRSGGTYYIPKEPRFAEDSFRYTTTHTRPSGASASSVIKEPSEDPFTSSMLFAILVYLPLYAILSTGVSVLFDHVPLGYALTDRLSFWIYALVTLVGLVLNLPYYFRVNCKRPTIALERILLLGAPPLLVATWHTTLTHPIWYLYALTFLAAYFTWVSSPYPSPIGLLRRLFSRTRSSEDSHPSARKSAEDASHSRWSFLHSQHSRTSKPAPAHSTKDATPPPFSSSRPS